MIIRRVLGDSMLPTLKEGQIVIAKNKKYKIGDVVIARLEGREVIKRVQSLSPKLILKGDNKNSAVYDDVSESDIVGTVLWPKIKI